MSSDDYPTVTVRLADLRLLLYGFDNPEATALGSRPFKRLRAAAATRDDEVGNCAVCGDDATDHDPKPANTTPGTPS